MEKPEKTKMKRPMMMMMGCFSLAAAYGCSGPNPDRNGVAASALSAEAEAFIGTWNCAATQVLSCPTGSRADDLYGTVRILPGDDPSSIVSTVISPVVD